MLKPVQIFVEEDTLEWAGIEAIKGKMSRQKFLTQCIEREKKISKYPFKEMLKDILPTKSE
jgi:hypothetical protein